MSTPLRALALVALAALGASSFQPADPDESGPAAPDRPVTAAPDETQVAPPTDATSPPPATDAQVADTAVADARSGSDADLAPLDEAEPSGEASAAAAAETAAAEDDPSLLLREVPSVSAARQRVGEVGDGTITLDGRQVRVGSRGEVDWSDALGGGRGFLRLLHGHLIVADLAVLAADGDDRARQLAMGIVDHWAAANPRRAPADPMAWHDETTALRTLHLLTLRDAVAGAERDRLDALLRTHVELLLDDGFHSTGTNHGMFQDRAVLAWAGSPAGSGALRDTAMSTGTRRLLDYLTTIVAPDGVHLEHSPAYHQVIFGNINRFTGFYTAVGDDATVGTLDGLRDRMVRYSTHVLQPDGSFPMVGDTATANVPSRGLTDDPGYRYAVTAGRTGTAPRETDGFFPDGDYAIMRDAWQPGPAGTYLHFTAAFHTDYHKHADDLSLWLYHDGELLTEAGPNGYDYADPFTVYGYGASAHNGILVDGAGVPRTGGRTSHVSLTGTSRSGAVSTAEGLTERLPHGRWRRHVRYDRAADTVTVSDRVSLDRTRRTSLRWHTAPGVRVHVARDGAIALTRGGIVAARMRVTTDAGTDLVPRVHRGARSPVAGWRLGGGTPVAVDTMTFDHTSATPRLVTTIELADSSPPALVSTSAVCGSSTDQPFADVSGTHAAAIGCAARAGIVEGIDRTTFAPTRSVTRAQLASMLARTMSAAGAPLAPAADPSPFPDVTGGPHRDNIAAMYEAGLIKGTTDGRFDPGSPVTRAQAASLLTRTLERLAGAPLPDGPAYFADVSGTHASAIRKATRAGLIAGDGRVGFSPNGDLTRAQGATLLTRLYAAAELRTG